jgi:hypothetical protein
MADPRQDEIRKLLEAGQVKAARVRLQEALKSGAHGQSASEVQGWAQLCRRSGLPINALRILKRGWEAHHFDPLYVAEYGAALIEIGALGEAREKLLGLKASSPDAHMYLGLSYVSDWSYAEAIQSLNKAIHGFSESSYWRLVAQTNLVACYVAIDESQQAADYALKIEPSLKTRKAGLLLQWTQLMRAQALFQLEDFGAARALLKATAAELDERTRVGFVAAKWLAILDLKEKPSGAAQVKRVEALKHRAIELKLFEGVRDLEFYQALYTRDPQRALAVFAGSPYRSYRLRVKQRFESAGLSVPEFGQQQFLYYRHLGKNKGAPVELDLAAELSQSRKKLGFSDLQYVMVQSVARDFYKPAHFYSMHERLYPDQDFDPTQSLERLKKILQRSRLVLKSRYGTNLDLDQGHLYLSANQKNLQMKLRIEE